MLELKSEKVENIKKRSYKHNRQPHELLVHTGVSLPINAMKELESLGNEHKMKLATVMRHIVLRGLAANRRDGLLDEPVETLAESTAD